MFSIRMFLLLSAIGGLVGLVYGVVGVNTNWLTIVFLALTVTALLYTVLFGKYKADRG